MYAITIHLARSPQFPNGSASHGYSIVAPLDDKRHLDADAWSGNRDQCKVAHFWGNEPVRYGMLRHRKGGAGGATWIIDYDEARSDDDEEGYRLNSHAFVVGEYVTISDNQGPQTYRIISVKNMSALDKAS